MLYSKLQVQGQEVKVFICREANKRRGAGPVIFWLNRQIGGRDTDEDTNAGHSRCLFVLFCCRFIFLLFFNVVSISLPHNLGPMYGGCRVFCLVLSFVAYFFLVCLLLICSNFGFDFSNNHLGTDVEKDS